MSEQESLSDGAGQLKPAPGVGDAQADGTKTTPRSATSPDVGTTEVKAELASAIHLGWRMAELYAESMQVVVPAAGSGTLPGVSRLNQRQIILLHLREIVSDMSSLGAGSVSAADLTSVAQTMGNQISAWAPPAVGQAETPVTAEVLASLGETVYSVHCELLSLLSSTDRQLGIAYGMGRAMADLYLRPVTSKAEVISDMQGRIARIQQWLLNLKSCLAPHAAEGVSQSMTVWQDWVDGADTAAWEQEAPWQDPLHPSTTGSAVSWALCEQAARWRQVLTGETVATDLLSADDLAQAGNGLLQRLYKLGTQLWARYWPIVVPMIVVLAGVVVGVSFAAGGTGTIVSTLGALAGLFGITWKGTRATLGSVIERAEGPLWDAELDLAVAKAITVLPGNAHVHVEVPRSGLGQALIPRRLVPSPSLTQTSA